jgi:hypothetical protein
MKNPCNTSEDLEENAGAKNEKNNVLYYRPLFSEVNNKMR